MSQAIQSICLFAALSAVALTWTGCSPSTSELRGQEFFDLHCATCHQGPTPDLKKQPPRLEGLFEAKKLPSGAPATDKQVRKTIIEGLGTMPAFDQRLRDADLDDLVTYLHTLK
jgi:mono/diheme cytochrome c family protein